MHKHKGHHSESSTNNDISVQVKRLVADAPLPVYGSEGAARFDLFSVRVQEWRLEQRTIIFGTGLAFAVPTGHEMVVMGRSGLGFSSNIRLANCEGVIDSDYRGEVLLAVTADTDDGWRRLCNIANEDTPQRIAQGKVQEVMRTVFHEVQTLSKTVRGESGLGSTGLGVDIQANSQEASSTSNALTVEEVFVEAELMQAELGFPIWRVNGATAHQTSTGKGEIDGRTVLLTIDSKPVSRLGNYVNNTQLRPTYEDTGECALADLKKGSPVKVSRASLSGVNWMFSHPASE